MYRITEENIVCCICVLMVRRLMTTSMASLDSMTSYWWSHNLQKRRIRKLGPGSTIRMDRHCCQCQSLKWTVRHILANLIVIGVFVYTRDTQKVQWWCNVFDCETTLVSMFTIICSTICRRHDRRTYSNINDQCVFCCYDPQHTVRELQLMSNVVFRCVCLIVCVTLGP